MGRFNAGWMALRSELVRFGHHLHRASAAYGVLLIALLLTLLASHYVRQDVEAQERTQFKASTAAAQGVIFRRVIRYLDVMYGARGLFLGEGTVDREDWDAYVRALDPEARGIRGLNDLQFLGFAKRVRPSEKEAFSREAQKEGVRDLWPEPNRERSAYFPLKFVAPSNEANRRMIDYDAYSDPAYRSAMDRARDTGLPHATGLVHVLTDASPNSEKRLVRREGVALYLPVYQKGEPRDTVAERRDALKGFIVATFTTDKLFGGAFAHGQFHPAIDFEVYEGRDVVSSPLLYDSNDVKNAGEKDSAALFSMERRIKSPLGSMKSEPGQYWTLYFATLPAFEEELKTNLPVFVLVSGITLSLLLFGITLMLVRSRSQAIRANADFKEANRELEEANTELQRSREGLVSAREEERRRLRRDLHDGVGPQLAALMLELEIASELVPNNPEASALTGKLSKRAREIVADVRHSVHALRPPALDELGLVGALREGAVQHATAGLRVSIESDGDLSHLPAAVEVACYRIAQEAITNVVRHAGASRCSLHIRLDEVAGALSLEVKDDGRGIREDDRTGVGMISMRERTEELGGWCVVQPSAGGGTVVRALLPFQIAGNDSHREV